MYGFEEIVAQLQDEMPEFPADTEERSMAAMPELTPGEGSAFGLAALLIGAGLVADLDVRVQLASIAGGVLLGIAGAFTTGRIRVARNLHAAAVAEANAFSIPADDDDEENT